MVDGRAAAMGGYELMKINEQDVAVFGAHLTMDYTVGGYEIDSSAFMGRKRSTFILLNHTTGF